MFGPSGVKERDSRYIEVGHDAPQGHLLRHTKYGMFSVISDEKRSEATVIVWYSITLFLSNVESIV